MTAFALALMLAAMMVAAGTGVLALAGAGGRRLAKRARRIGARAEVRHRTVAGPSLRRGAPRGLDALAARILPRPAAIRQRLLASGLRLTISGYLGMCAAVALVVGALAVAEAAPVPVAILLGLLAGLAAPHVIVGSRIAARRKAFSNLFPDAIGLMVRGLKAGLPVMESLLIVGRECAGPVGEEFRRIGDQVRLGQPLDEAMWSVARRVELQEFSFMVITLGIQRETGGNLAETLQNLDAMVRMRAQMRLKIKAMSSEAMATATIIGSLPFAMAAVLLFVARGYVMTLMISPLGRLMVGGGLAWLGIGVFIMAQMVRFEI